MRLVSQLQRHVLKLHVQGARLRERHPLHEELPFLWKEVEQCVYVAFFVEEVVLHPAETRHPDLILVLDRPEGSELRGEHVGHEPAHDVNCSWGLDEDVRPRKRCPVHSRQENRGERPRLAPLLGE